MQSRPEVCSQCCGLALSPTAPELALGQTLQLWTHRARGPVVWESLAPPVAAVDPTGLVRSVAEGVAVVRAVDASGCVAETEVRVFCGLSLDSQAGGNLAVGETTPVVGTGHQGAPSWTVDNPASLAITQDFGPTVEVTAVAIGGARLTATDAAGCSASLDFTVNHP
jgi:uncharacterized protein YjdB